MTDNEFGAFASTVGSNDDLGEKDELPNPRWRSNGAELTGDIILDDISIAYSNLDVDRRRTGLSQLVYDLKVKYGRCTIPNPFSCCFEIMVESSFGQGKSDDHRQRVARHVGK